MEASTPLPNIPNKIIRHILLQLPMKNVIRCQCVCNQWRSLIDDSDFKNSYRGQRRVIILLHESEIHDDNKWDTRLLDVRSASHDFRFQRHEWPFGEAAYPVFGHRALCSCNGFVLLVVLRDIWLWNPSTKCSTKVLELPYEKESNSVMRGGLCYDSCTRDYKAVLSICLRKQPVLEFGLISASLNHKEWRSGQFPYNLVSANGSVEFRNTFHWWASDIKDWDWDEDRDLLLGGDRNKIVYFDPVCDEFRILPTPKLRQNFSVVGLGVIDDCLSVACFPHKQDCHKQERLIQVLIMKEYGRQESWMTAFAIQMPQLPYTSFSYGLTFYSQKNNAQQVLFLRTTCWEVYVYDREKDDLREVRMDFVMNEYPGRLTGFSMCFYVESLACSPVQPHMIN